MPGAADFKIRITGKDETGGALDSAGQRFKKFGETVGKFTKPLGAIHRSFEEIATSKGFGAFDRFASRFGQIGSLAAGVGEGFGDLGGLAAAAMGAASALGAIAAAGALAVRAGRAWSITGSEIQRSSNLIGMGADDLQRFRGAGKMVGVESDAMTSSLFGLSNAMEGAFLGSNVQARAAFNSLRIPITDASGNLRSLKDVYLDLADAMKRQNPNMRRVLAGILGVTPSLPVLTPGKAQLQRDLAAVPIGFSGGDTQGATAFQRQWALLTERWQALKDKTGALAGNAIAPLLGAVNTALGGMDHVFNHPVPGKGESPLAWALGMAAPIMDKMGGLMGLQGRSGWDEWRDNETGVAPSPASASGAAPSPTTLRRLRGPWLTRAVAEAQGLMRDLGLTGPQAAGIVSNLVAESGVTGRNERNPLIPGSRGGLNLAQWTGPRRRQFEAWSAAQGLDPSSPQAGHQFLTYDMRANWAPLLQRIRATASPRAAARLFFEDYETQGAPGLQGLEPGHERYADVIAAATRGAGGAAPQKVNVTTTVDVRFTNAPPGTIATARTNAGSAIGSAMVMRSMPGAR